jgi:hypothetical protein
MPAISNFRLGATCVSSSFLSLCRIRSRSILWINVFGVIAVLQVRQNKSQLLTARLRVVWAQNTSLAQRVFLRVCSVVSCYCVLG